MVISSELCTCVCVPINGVCDVTPQVLNSGLPTPGIVRPLLGNKMAH